MIDNSGTNEIIVDSEIEIEYPCQAEIIQNSFQITAPLSQLILDIFDDSDNNDYDLVFNINESLRGTPYQGATQPSSIASQWNSGEFDIIVGLNPELLNNGTDLAIASTVIHESIHAVLLYMVETGRLTLDNTSPSTDQNLFLLVQRFIRLKIRENEFGGVEQSDVQLIDQFMHRYMTNFIEDIATSISEFGNSRGHNISFNYYKKLAAIGLESNIEYYMMLDDELDANEEAELTDINNTLLDEFKNRPDAKGTKCTNR